MALREEIIRITLEGRDKLSQVLRGADKDVQNFERSASKSFKNLDSDVEKTRKNLGKFVDDLGNDKNFAKNRNQLAGLSRSWAGLRSEIRGTIDAQRAGIAAFGGGTSTRGPGGRFIPTPEKEPSPLRQAVTGFSQGLKQTKEIQDLIIAGRSTEAAAVRKRKDDLANQLRDDQAATRVKNRLEEAANNRILNERKEAVARENAELQAASDKLKASQLAAVQKEIRLRSAAGDEQIRSVNEGLKDTENRLRAQRTPQNTAQIDDQLKQERTAASERRQIISQGVASDIERLKNAEAEIRAKDDVATKHKILLNNAAFEDFKIKSEEAVRKEGVDRQNGLINAYRVASRELKSPSALTGAKITEAALGTREIDKSASAFQRLGQRAGFALGDIRRGFASGKQGITDFGKEGQKVETRLARMGQAAGSFVRNLGQLVRFKPLLIISGIQLLGNLVVQLGAAFIALASSAALAGAALGGALTSGLLQAVAAGGLLRAAFSRVSAVLTAVKTADQAKLAASSQGIAAEKQQRTSAEQLADAHYALKQAIQAVVDATYNEHQASLSVTKAHQDEKDAVQNLADARKQAARDIVDAVFAERDAALSLKEAELGVLQAKQNLINLEKSQLQSQADIKSAQEAVKEAQARLAQVRQQGDQQQILAAEQQLAVAQNAVSDLQTTAQTSKADVESAQVAVKRAQLSRDEAVVQNKRVQQDSEQTRKKGVTGSQQVLDAQKQLRDSIQQIAQAEHALADSERSRADAVHGVSIAQRNLKDTTIDAKNATAKAQGKDALAGLDPAEKRLAASVERIKALYKKNFGPITDIIINAISRAVDRSSVLLKDPKFLDAFRTLATSIGKAFDRISKFTISPEFRKSIEFFATSAAKNIPTVTDAFLNLLTAILRIGKEATPIFENLLGRFDRVTQRIKKFTDPAKTITNLGAGSDARDRPGQRVTTQSPLENFLGLADKHLQSWIHLGDAIGKVIAALIHGSQGTGKGFVDGLADGLDRLARFLNTHQEEVHKFFENLRKDLQGLGPIIGHVFGTLFKAFSGDQGTAFAKIVLTVILPGLGLLLGIIGKVSQALLILFKVPLLGKFLIFGLQVAVAEKALNRIFPATQAITNGFKKLVFGFPALITQFREFIALTKAFGFAEAFAAVFPRLASGIRLVGLAFKFVFVTNPWIGAILLIIAAIVLLDRKFHFIRPTIEFLGKLFKDIFGWITDHWKLLAAIIFGPIGLAIDAIVTHWETIKKAFTAAFHFIAGIAKKIGKVIYDEIIGSFIDIGRWASNIAGWLNTHVFSLFKGAVTTEIGKIAKSIFDGFISGFTKIADWFRNIGSWLNDHIISPILKFFGIHSASRLMFQIGMDIVHGLVNAFLLLPGLILAIIKFLPDRIVKLFKGLGDKIKNSVKDVAGGVAGALGITTKGLNEVAAGTVIKEFSLLNAKGLSKSEAIKAEHKRHPKIPTFALDKIATLAGYASGGRVQGFAKGTSGFGTDTVPAMLTPGEWVLNAGQQLKLASRLKTSVRDLSMALFGTHSNTAPELISEHGAGQNRINRVGKLGQSDPYAFPNATLHPQTDADGNQIWFIEFGDRSWGQVTANAAQRIISTKGGWIPGYALRASKLHRGLYGDPKLNTLAALRATVQNSGLLSDAHNRFALGGIVPAVQGFARGGPALNRPGGGNHTTKNINMTMQPIVQGDSDWSYVMRIAAQTAESSF